MITTKKAITITQLDIQLYYSNIQLSTSPIQFHASCLKDLNYDRAVLQQTFRKRNSKEALMRLMVVLLYLGTEP